jgi:hypothetical protein
MAHIVTVPLVITRNPGGPHIYLYQGAELPEGHHKDEVKRLVDEGMVEEVGGKSTSTAKSE